MRFYSLFRMSFLIFIVSALAYGEFTGDSEKKPEEGLEYLLFAEMDNVFSAAKQIQKNSVAPAKIVVITAQQIKIRGYVDMEEILHDLSGFDFDKGMGVEWSTIYMRGIRTDNSDRFLLIWDGIIQNDIWKQNVWISRQYPLSNIKRIEIMYGPSSLLYGANAFSGIINVILKDESEVNGISGSVNVGSFNTQLYEINFGKKVEDWRFMLNGRIYQSDEYDMNGEYWIDNAGRKRYYSATYPTDYDLSSSSLSIVNGQLWWTDNGIFQPFDPTMKKETNDWFIQGGIGYKKLDFTAYTWYRNETEDSWYVPQKRVHGPWKPIGSAAMLSYIHEFTSDLISKTYARYRTSGYDDQKDGDPSFKTNFTNNVNASNELKIYKLSGHTYYKQDVYEWCFGEQFNCNMERWNHVLGFEYIKAVNDENYITRTLTSAPWSSTPTHDERNFGMYVNSQFYLSDIFSIAGGLRYDYNYLQGEDGGFGNLFNYRIAGIYTPNASQYAKLIYGTSFQAPDSWHKYSKDGDVRPVASTDLNPEFLQTLELIYGQKIEDNWDNSISIYYTQVEDLIGIVSFAYGSGTATKFGNTDKLEVIGSEFESRYTFSENKTIYANITYATAENPDTNRKSGDIAPWKANIGCDLLLQEKYGLAFRTHLVSERDTVTWDSSSIYSVKSVDSYISCDLNLSWFDFMTKGLDLKFAMYNIFNAKYYDPGVRTADGKGYNGAVLQEPFHANLGLSYQY